MDTSNHSSKLVHDRLYCLTPCGSRLAHYLDYVRWQPTLQQDLGFADLPVPEHHDEDREQPERDDWQPQDPGQAGYERDDIPGWILDRDDDDHDEPEPDEPEPDEPEPDDGTE